MLSKKRDMFGIILTVVYLGGIILYICIKWDTVKTIKLNELGDFLAGAFSPVAFLWLFLGYMQQGEEIKANTEEIKRQAQATEDLVSLEKKRHGM